MSSLEDLLLDSGAMTKTQLAIVRDEQEKKGGSLDLNILALGYLTEHALQRIIEQLWNQVGQVDFEQAPTKGAIALLSEEQAQTVQAVPQSVLGQQLYVLVHDRQTVDRLAELDELTEYDIVPVGLNEVRLKYLLERCYNVPRSERDMEIMERLMKQAAAAKERHAAALDALIGDPMAGLEPGMLAGAIVVESPPPEPAATLEELDEDDIPILEDELLIEVVDEEEFDAGEESSGERALEEDHQVMEVDDFEETLASAESMDALPDVFFRFGVPYFKSMAIFKVQGGMLHGWRGAGLGIVPEMIRGIVVPAQSDTFLAKGIEQGVYMGRGGSNAVEEGLTEQLGSTPDAHIVTGAIAVGDRPVMVVCGLTEEGEPGSSVADELKQLCQLASQTVVRLIMERKKAKQAEQAKQAKQAEQDEQEGGELEDDEQEGDEQEGDEQEGDEQEGDAQEDGEQEDGEQEDGEPPSEESESDAAPKPKKRTRKKPTPKKKTAKKKTTKKSS
ncbi:MAG: hypothetical protein ABI333_14700 [bacterium]